MNLTNYQIQALKYIIPYLRQNEDLAAILKSTGLRFNNLQEIINYLSEALTINDARGIWLDNIGAEVGAQRDEMDFGDYFCVNRLHINSPQRFYFLSSGFNPESPLSLSDAEFIQKILSYIGANKACGTRKENINIIKIMTNADAVKIIKTGPCTVKIELSGKSLVLTQNTINYIQQAVGGGIYVEEISY